MASEFMMPNICEPSPAPYPTAVLAEGFFAEHAAADAADRGRPAPLGGWPKRPADIAIAALALLLALPLMLAVALLIKATSAGPVIYVHSRVGYRGKPFGCYKFRTMAVDAERLLPEYLARHPQAALEWRGDAQAAPRPPGHAKSGVSCARAASTSCRSSATCFAAT